jgi:CubicO group peptidase (beta-lactamase class C family)
MRYIVALVVLVLPIIAAPLASVPTVKPEDVGLSSERLGLIDRMIERRIAAGEIAGAVTIVARNGKVAHLSAKGMVDLESKQPMRTSTMFRIASMTKPVTGVAIMMLVEEGKLRLNDPVSRYIPEFRGQKVAVAPPGAPTGGRGAQGGQQGQRGQGAAAPPQFTTVAATRDITIKDLLSHVSGLGSGAMGNSDIDKVARKEGETLAQYVPRLGTTSLEFQPGSRWAYSGSAGFEVLGRIVEIVSGLPLDQFFRQRIFDPLGMKDIAFWPSESQWTRVASVYQRGANGLTKQVPANDTSSRGVYFRASGGLYSTAEDYIPLGVMLADMGEFNSKHLLGRKTVEMMTAAHVLDTLPGRAAGEGYGLSVRVVTDHTRRGTMLSDGTYGWSGAQGTHFFVDPKEKLVGVLMVQTSIGEMQRDFEDLVAGAVIR